MDQSTYDDRVIEKAIAEIDALPLVGRYGIVVPAITSLSTPQLRQLIAKLANRFQVSKSRFGALPPSVGDYYKTDLERIVADARAKPDEYFRSSNDVFIKDLAIASQRMVPAGAQIAHLTGVPRRSLLQTRGFEWIKALLFFARLGGFSSFYEIHTHTPVLSEFNEAGWIRCYKRLAKLLVANLQVKGVMGAAWFFDPAIATVSPRLAYLRSIPVDNGALSMFVSAGDEKSISLATATSDTRRMLYAEGKYVPATYMLVWGREDLIRWASR
jgi:hypothetical protein